MNRGCLRIELRPCGVEDLVRGHDGTHLCVCAIFVQDGAALLDGQPAFLPWFHATGHRCGTCGRSFTLLPTVDMSPLPGLP
jgi:hypothetical protein